MDIKFSDHKKISYLLIFVVFLSIFLNMFSSKENVYGISDKTTESIIGSMSVCLEGGKQDECYKNSAKDFVDKFSIREIMYVFREKEKTEEFFERCHLTSHFIGQEAYKKYKDVKKIFSEGTSACLGGIYHGAIEGYFMENNAYELGTAFIKSEINKICGTRNDYTENQKFVECNHGLGHATMYLTENDLPKALDLCDATNTTEERELCYSGALMANSDSFNSNDHPTKYIKADEPLYPCPILKDWQQGQCYTYGVLGRFQQDLNGSINICYSVPDKFKSECFETIGRDRTVITQDVKELISQCGQIKDENFKNSCMSGTAYNLIIRFGPNSDIAQNYCKITDDTFKKDCYEQIVKALRNMTRDIALIQNFCEKIKDVEYRNLCLNNSSK